MSRTELVVFILVCAFFLLEIVSLAGSVALVGVGNLWLFGLGVLRVGFSYGAGVLIWRSRLYLRLPRVSGILLILVAGLIFVIPLRAWWYDAFAVFLGAPALVALGAAARSGAAGLTSLWLTLGALSYPLYVVHQPVLRGVIRLMGGSGVMAALAGMAALLLTVVLFHYYDAPLRRRLETALS